MNLSRLRLGELVGGAAAVGLLVTLFLGWNRDLAPLADGGPSTHSGWGALGWLMVLLLLVVIALAFALVATTVGRSPAALPIGAAVLTTGVGIIVAIVLIVRVLLLDDALGTAYVGLALGVLIPVGGWITMADERTEAPYSAAPDLPRRPAPPAEA